MAGIMADFKVPPLYCSRMKQHFLMNWLNDSLTYKDSHLSTCTGVQTISFSGMGKQIVAIGQTK